MEAEQDCGDNRTMWFWREREAVLSAWERLESGEDVVDLGAAGVIGVDVDEPHDAVAVDDQDGRHRQYGAAVRTGGADVDAELALCREAVLGGLERDSERGGELEQPCR